MVCCDTCPYSPTCEELADLDDDWGESDEESYCVTPGCRCCGGDDD